MNIKDVEIENAVLESQKGLVCQEAEGLRLKNVALFSSEIKPVLEVQNSRTIVMGNIRYPNGADLLLRVTGDRSKNMKLVNTTTKAAKEAEEVGKKVSKKAVTVSSR